MINTFLTQNTSAFDLDLVKICQNPFEHIFKPNFIKAEVYEELQKTFPECPSSTGPTGFSYYWGDEEYDRLIRENWAWKAFFESAHSPEFINYCIQQFLPVYTKHSCSIDLSKATYAPYRETREDKEKRTLTETEYDPEQLWVRLDIHQGRIGYYRDPHLDHSRRLISMLIYFCDADENKMEGGEIVLHTRRKLNLPWELKTIKPRHNEMVCFACTNKSYHSVPKILSSLAPRNFVQIQISSCVPVWPR